MTYQQPFDSYDFVEVNEAGFSAILPRFSSLPEEITLPTLYARDGLDNEYDYFNRCLEVLCNCLAPEKMEEIRQKSVSDVVKIVQTWMIMG